jgi:hypothetical protein
MARDEQVILMENFICCNNLDDHCDGHWNAAALAMERYRSWAIDDDAMLCR